MTMRSHSKLQEAAGAVMVDPALAGLRTLRTAMVVCIVLCILSFVGLLVVSRFGLHLLLSAPFNPLFLAIYMIYPLIMVTILMRLHKRLEQRRQRAATGDASLLAVEQPAPYATAFSLPITIGQRPKWGTLLLFPGILLALMTVLVLLLIISPPYSLLPPPNGQPLPQSVVFILVGSLLIVTLLLCGLLIALLYAVAKEQITVTEHGLIKVGLLRKVHSVPWQEARLFAIDGVKKYRHPIVYELSSAHDIVRLVWMRRSNRRVIFFAQPTGSVEEYERQMQGLLSLIAARTGLPLYDLR
jgi:hypothetical protein